MRLKLLMTSALALGFVMLFLWPWVLRQRPMAVDGHKPLRREANAFQLIFTGYVGASVFSFMAAGSLAALMMRNAREEYANQAMSNVRELVEGSMDDLRSRKSSGPKL